MATVTFTNHLRDVAPERPVETDAETVAAALDDVFGAFPRLRSYVVDEQGRLRKHVAVFVDGEFVPGAEALDRRLAPGSDVHVMQALSGGAATADPPPTERTDA